MRNRIHLVCIVSIFVTIGLSACGLDFSLGHNDCDPSKRDMWCEGDNVMACVYADVGGMYNYRIRVEDTCASGKCVEFQWPGKQQEAACLIPDKQCPEEGFEYTCDGTAQVTCTPKGGVVSHNNCAVYGLYNWSLNENDHFKDFEPTCVVLDTDHATTCALSNEPCNNGESKCAESASGRSLPIRCIGGFWNYDEYDCVTGLWYEDFPWICAFSNEKARYICAFSADECTDNETRCTVSPTTGKKVLEFCSNGLWSDGKLCTDCTTEPDGTNSCVQ